MERRDLRLVRTTVEGSLEPDHERTVTAVVPIVAPCQICKGAGFLRSNKPYGHPEFGKSVACACKVAQAKAQRQYDLIQMSGITNLARFKKATFGTFNSTLPHMGNAYKRAKQFAACPLGWLVMTGPVGCGKTHLAVAIAKQCIEDGHTVIIQTVPDLLDHLRSAFNPVIPETYEDRFKEIKEVELLVLDDYGAQQNTPWANETLFQLMNYRYNANLPTVVTSNDVHMQNIDARVRDRMCDRELVDWVRMEGARSYRVHGDGQEQEEDD